LITYEQNRATAKDDLIQAKKIWKKKEKSYKGQIKNVEKVESWIKDWMKEATIEEEILIDKEL
jgi:hypothetical protein